MDESDLRELIEQIRSGSIDAASAVDRLRTLPFADLGYARVDHHRALRQGVPEVVLGEGKSAEQIVGVARELIRTGQNVLVTRLDAERAASVVEQVPELEYVATARLARYVQRPMEPLLPRAVPVVSAGTSDMPVAEEAVLTLELCGIPAARVYDVGVAGIHRVVGHLDELRLAPAVIVVAGMEGALASVVGGLIAVPVIAVPTSVGYGISMGGLTALFGMLSSCAAGITVVNIDNGFGAAMAVRRLVAARAGVES